MDPKYSVIIPLKDEEGNIEPLIAELEPIMEGMKAPWELICVDDGSTDRTLEILETLASKKPYLRTIIFNGNFGQSSAFDAGFQNARGELVVTLDGDRQNDPADIPKLLEKIEQGWDLVCGKRAKRKDTYIKRITSKIANAVRSRICRDGVSDTGCSLKVYRARCLKKIKMFNGMHRFLPALFNLEGFSIVEVPVNHRPRPCGSTKYNFLNRSFNTVADMFAVRWMRKRRLAYKVKKELP